jgi:Zn-dependent protease
LETEIIGFYVIWFVVFLLSLSFHESAHAWTSERFGDDTGRLQGRITLNPLAHIDPIGTIIFPLISMITTVPLLGWAKPVETNPLRWRDKTKANISVSAAGPISNFILLGIAFVVLKVLLGLNMLDLNPQPRPRMMPYDLLAPTPGQPAYLEPLAMFLMVMLVLNAALAIFNLIPIPPLDGSHVLESLLPPQMADAYNQIRPFGFLLLMAMLYLGVLGYIFTPIMRLIFEMLIM